jgi:hypothetical protein
VAETTGKICGSLKDVCALQAVNTELRRARELHQSPIHNVAEGYAIILEELDEFWDEVKHKPKNRVPEDLAKELVQVAAMACRTLVDCDLVKRV